MSALHCFVRATLASPIGPDTEIWLNVSEVTSIMKDSDGGSHVLMGANSTSLHMRETPTEIMETAAYLTPSVQEAAPIYFGEEN
jgi:hypothetical protein